MDAGATGQVHEQESLRPVSGRPAQGARRDAATAEGTHRRGGAGGSAESRLPEPVRAARRLASAAAESEDGRAGTDRPVHAGPRGHRGGGRSGGQGERHERRAKPDGDRHAAARRRDRRRRLRRGLEFRRQQAGALHPDHHEERNDRRRRRLLARANRRNGDAGVLQELVPDAGHARHGDRHQYPCADRQDAGHAGGRRPRRPRGHVVHSAAHGQRGGGVRRDFEGS